MRRTLLLMLILLGLNLTACSTNDTTASIDGDADADEDAPLVDGDTGEDDLADGDGTDGDLDEVVADGDLADGDEDGDTDAEDDVTPRNEPYRPQVHYTPLSGWMNDPNGLLLANGKIHLMHQHAPDGFFQSGMHWGHATSTDYLHWTQTDTAIFPDDTLGQAFSGSAVVDANNDSGLCGGVAPGLCILVFYTHSGGHDGKQKQSLAVSTDGGESFTPYADNPILMPPDGVEDFRDPNVIYSESTNGEWIMTLTGGDRILFYESENLIDWTPSGELLKHADDPTGTWECPDLFTLYDPLKQGLPNVTWVLQLDVFSGGPSGGSGSRYMLGNFDNGTFRPWIGHDSPLWIDYGPDFYAMQSWTQSALPGSQRSAIAWMNNWSYALQIDTEPWQGAMTLARRLKIESVSGIGYALVQNFPDALAGLRGDPIELVDYGESGLRPYDRTELCTATVPYEFAANLDIGNYAVMELDFESDGKVGVRLRFDFDDKTITVNRFASAWPWGGSQNLSYTVDAPLDTWMQSLQVVVDRSSIELLLNDGSISLTIQAFWPGDSLTLSAQDSTLTGTLIRDMQAWELRSIWATAQETANESSD